MCGWIRSWDGTLSSPDDGNVMYDPRPVGFQRSDIKAIQAGPAKKPIIRQSGISFERQRPTENRAYPRNQLDAVVILSSRA